ncbi:SdrD B-like domain-containing protein [Paenibacillus sp. PAMC21692]|uniref:SdrD B-like domain-containing protein n=1 Tax=Paenibacillus sp. PAMC21692 TaxID=2762320 RepID=UPI00164ECAD3|nr:SdrD B-like domain-containing protein [Paenibacillus sp. PAMC21692]QNK58400.1 LPXTG cell wall anchor domain-containing protein [Paenibacillus sp. PAMC21692]
MRASRLKKKTNNRMIDFLQLTGFTAGLADSRGSLRKKSISLLLALMLLLQTVQIAGVVQQTAAAGNEITHEIIQRAFVLNAGRQVYEENDFAVLKACFTDPTGAGCPNLLATVTPSSPETDGNNFNTTLAGAASAPFTLAYEWLIDDNIAQNGGVYVFDLPSQLTLATEVSGDLGGAGTFIADPVTKKVTLNFIQQPAPEPTFTYNLTGGILIETRLDSTTVISNEDVVISIPFRHGGNVTVNLPVKLTGATPNITKAVDTAKGTQGLDRTPNTSLIYWVVDVNTSLADIGQTILAEVLPTGLAVEGAIEVKKLHVPISGAPTEGNAVAAGSDYTYVNSDSNFPLEFADLNAAYRIRFATKVTNAAVFTNNSATFINKVVLKNPAQAPPDDEITHATASQTVQRGNLLEKTNGGSKDSNKHRVTWTVIYNKGELELNNPTLTDLFPAGHELAPEATAFTVEKGYLNSNGGFESVLVLPSGAIGVGNDTYTKTDDPTKTGFSLQLNGDVTGQHRVYRIVYTTQEKEDSPITANITGAKNKVDSTTPGLTGSVESSVNYGHRVIQKSGEVIDYDNKIIRWTITLNENDYRFMGSPTNPLKLVDTFNSKGLTYIPGTLSIKNKANTDLTSATGNYSFAVDADGNGFVLEFKDSFNFNQKHTVVYDTYFDYGGFDVLWNSDDNYKFKNTGTFSWDKIVSHADANIEYTTNNNDKTISASAEVDPEELTQFNGRKSGVYNPATKTIKWTVLFNYHNESVVNALISDTLNNDQVLLPATVKVLKHAWSDAAAGVLDAGTVVSAAAYVLDPATNKLEIEFPGTISGPHTVEFETSLVDKFVPGTIHNTASFTSDDNDHYAELTASVSPPHGGEIIVKELAQPNAANRREAEWTIWINRSFSKLTNVRVNDWPDNQQTIVEESFKLFKVDPRSAEPYTLVSVPESQYSIRLKQPGDAADAPAFTLLIGNENTEIETAYQLKYTTILAKNIGHQAKNSFELLAEERTVESIETQETFTNIINSGSGFSSPGTATYKGSVKVIKRPASGDPDNDFLAGAKFVIKVKGSTADYDKYEGVTNAAGEVLFVNLPYGQYELEEIEAPNGYKLDSTVRDVVISSTNQVEIELDNTHEKGKIGDYIWLDLDKDGIQDDTEPGIDGLTVKLYKPGNPVAVATQTTRTEDGKKGYYLFENLVEGDYIVEFDWPVDYELTLPEQGSKRDEDSHLLTGKRTGTITINYSNNYEDLKVDIGLIAKGAIGDYVWLDWNRDGIQNDDLANPPDKVGLNGIEVKLYKKDGAGALQPEGVSQFTRNHPADHTRAGQPGYYWFDHLLSGTYVVEFLVPRSYTKTDVGKGTPATDSNVVTAGAEQGDHRIPYRTEEIVIGPAKWKDPTIDLGLQALGKIGDYVWFDKNDNGSQDAGEPGIENIIVELFKQEGGTEKLVATTKTDADGKYLFDHLIEGNYYVKFQTPGIYDLAKMEENGVTAENDSNLIVIVAGPDKGKTVNAIPIGPDGPKGPAGWVDMTIDLGFTGKGAIGNYVWHDRNRDGIQNEDPMHGINGVTVNLYRDTVGGTPYKTDVTKTEDGKPGYYNFKELPQGTYYVEFKFPSEYEKTDEESDADSDSDLDSNKTSATHVTDAIVISETATPYGWVNPSIDLGLVAQGSIGNYVWFDINRNGIQDASEQGLNDIPLRLYRGSDTGPVYAETKTVNGPDGKPGYYLFDNLASGNYFVQIVLDDDHEVTIAEQGSGAGADELDSNTVNPLTVNTTFAIAIGELAPKGWHDHTIDFGIVRKGAIGNYVWYDTDYNGKQDEEDRYGMNGVTVKLYDSTKTLLATTITADKDGKPGYYLFDHLVAGDYYVQFVTPYYYIPTKQAATGVSAELDSNLTFDSFTEAVAIGPVGPAVWRDMTIDQGYYYVPPVFPTPTPSPSPSTDPEETEEPGITPTPTPSPGTGTPTPTPGTGTPTPTPAPTPTSTTVTEKTPEDTPIDVEVDVPKGGTTATGTPPKNGSVTITPDGKVTYTPNKGYTGKDRFSVIIKDADGNEEEFWFDIDVEEPPRGGLEGTPDVSTLPKTGEESYLMLYLIGAAFVAIGIYLRFRNNRKTT